MGADGVIVRPGHPVLLRMVCYSCGRGIETRNPIEHHRRCTRRLKCEDGVMRDVLPYRLDITNVEGC